MTTKTPVHPRKTRQRKSATLGSAKPPRKSPPRIGFNSKFPVINQEYSRVRDFFFANIKGIFHRDPYEVAGVKGEALTWADTYRFTVAGGKWSLAVKDWNNSTWQPVDLADYDTFATTTTKATSTNNGVAALLAIQLFPIKVNPRLTARQTAQFFFNASITPILDYLQSPLTSSKLTDKFIRQHAPSATKNFLPSDFAKSFSVMGDVLRSRLAGRSNANNQRKQVLSGCEQAYRGLIKALWENIDREVLSLALSVSWREPLSLRKWLSVLEHQTDIKQIATEHRNLLPLLNTLPCEFWRAKYFTSPEALTAVIKHTYPQANSVADLELATLWFNNPASINYWGLKSDAMVEALRFADKLKGFGLPIWIRANLLRNFHRLPSFRSNSSDLMPFSLFTYQASPSSKSKEKASDLRFQQVTSDQWIKYSVDLINQMVAGYKQRKQFSAIQRFSSDFNDIIFSLFNGESPRGEMLPVETVLNHPDPVALSPDLQDILPSDHPWKVMLDHFYLSQIVPEGEPLASAKKKARAFIARI